MWDFMRGEDMTSKVTKIIGREGQYASYKGSEQL